MIKKRQNFHTNKRLCRLTMNNPGSTYNVEVLLEISVVE